MAGDHALSELFRYTITDRRPLHSGGCGDLWRAHDRLFDEQVAVKTIRSDLSSHALEKAQASFATEAIVAARLSRKSPNVVPVRDLGRLDDTLYLVMDWVDSGDANSADLSHMMGRLSVGAAKKVLLQMCDAVAIAHAEGIVHSDIAPWNVMYSKASDSYLLADFGLVKVVEANLISLPSRSLLQGGRLAFLPDYARRDIGRVSYATDVFALAVTFWSLLDARALHHEDRTPPVVRVARDQVDAPFQVRALLARFIEGHTREDSVQQFVDHLYRVPAR
ncbi:serine/threonine-protein kinase [Streptomyces sp. NPDC016309]|uniref:serine/threonine-protein kinase n=1 Tax=Streptomyces sp. NPDC016309 TaxID=3364965 RepID=UPI0037006106